MRKLLSLFLAVLMIITLMAGCGGGASTNEKADTAKPEAQVQTATKETQSAGTEENAATDKKSVSGKILVQSWQYGGGAVKGKVEPDALKSVKAIENYFKECYPKVDAEFRQVQYTDHYTKMKVDLAAGVGPDVMGIQVGAPLEEFKPFLQPLAPYAEKEWGEKWRDKFLPSAFIQIDQSGAKEVYALPMSMLYAGTMWYSQKILDNYSLKVPTNWNELKEVAKTLRANKEMPLVTGAKDSWINLDVFLAMAADINAEKVYSAIDGKGPWTDPDIVKAFDFWQKLFTEKVYQDGALGLNMYNEAYSLWNDDKGNSKAPLHTNGSWEMGNSSTTNANYKTYTSYNRDVALFPDVNGDGKACPVLISPDVVWVMNKDTKNAEAAWAFIRWQEDEEGQQAMTDGLSFFPAKLGVKPTVDMSPELKRIYDKYVEWGSTAVGGYREIKYPELKQALVDELQLLATSSVTPQKAGEDVEKASKAQNR